MGENEVIFSQVENSKGTKLKEIVGTEFQGKQYIQIREKWRMKKNEDWKFSKKVVSFNKNEFFDLIDGLIANDIITYDDLKVYFV